MYIFKKGSISSSDTCQVLSILSMILDSRNIAGNKIDKISTLYAYVLFW